MLEMEMKELYDNLSLWEQDLGLPEGTWTEGLLDSKQEDCRRGQVLEGDLLWKDADFPLKEASKDNVKDPDETFDLDVEFLKEDWLDERIDIGAMLDDFIHSPEFDAVLNDFDDSTNYLKSMDMTEESPITATIVKSENEVEVEEEVEVVEREATSDVEIETDELALEETAVIYLDPCEVSSPSTDPVPGPSQIHFVISPSISATNSSNEASEIEDVSNEEGSNVLCLSGLPQVAANDSVESPENSNPSSLKSKRARRKIRSEPYRSVWEDSNSGSSSSSNNNSSNSSICSSTPGSPLSEDLSDAQDEHPPKSGKRKERKKCQNRNAATKYRQKKRAESEAMGQEEQELDTKNKELKEKVNQLSTEIGYLKGLIREILIARGVLNK